MVNIQVKSIKIEATEKRKKYIYDIHICVPMPKSPYSLVRRIPGYIVFLFSKIHLYPLETHIDIIVMPRIENRYYLES